MKAKHFRCLEFHIETALRELHSMPCWPDEFNIFFNDLDVIVENKSHQRTLQRIKELADKYLFQMNPIRDRFNMKYIFHFKKVTQPT